MKFRKKAVVIDAVKYDGNYRCLDEFPFSEVMEFKVSKDGLIIPTLEGDMKASIGDYIIRGVKGEYYPCKPDIFEQTYELCDNIFSMDFSDTIKALKEGFSVSRYSWDGAFIVKQIPAAIGESVIPKMQSLPDSAKAILLRRNDKTIKYVNQLLKIDKDNNADSWNPTPDDMFAEDWFIIK